MRVALISDIHGNEIALELVLEEIASESVDLTVCLGDIATMGPKPRECLDRIRSLGIRSVMGNHDEFLLEPHLIREYSPPPAVIAAVDWCRGEMWAEDLAFLRSFEREIEVPLGYGESLRLFHGSPRSHMEMILATTPAEALDEMLDGRRGALLAGGHTHVQMLRQHKGQLILNTGAVGMPFAEDFKTAAARNEPPWILPHAEYAIVVAEQGRVQVDLRRVEIGAGRCRAATLASQMPMREVFAAQYL